MAQDFAGSWQLNILNSDPFTESNHFSLFEGMVSSLDTGKSSGKYEVLENVLLLHISMHAELDEGAWSLRISFPLNGALAGEFMLGHAKAVFADGEPIPVADCSFHRLRE